MLLTLLACGGPPAPDPELTVAAEALRAWRAGEAALRAGRAEEARAAFASASALRPDPVLAAWEARAATAAGDEAGAIARYRAALEGDPSLAAARWSLALLLARSGDPASAARELRRALEDGAGAPVDVRLDPEWAPWLADPAFAFVPPTVVGVRTASALPESTYWGSELTVDLEVTGRFGPHVVLGAAATGPVRLVSVAETVEDDRRTAAVVWRVVGAGAIALGPFTVTTAGATVEAPALTTTASAPPGKELSPPGPAWTVTSGDALPAELARVDGIVWVPVGPTDPALTDPPRPQLRVTQRRGDEVRAWIGLADLPAGATLRVGRGTQVRTLLAP
jgi:hypothetical protein